MRINRFVATVAGAGLVLLAGSATAASATPTYPPPAPVLTVSANSIVAGGHVGITGSGFLPGSSASVTWTGSGALGVGGKAFGTAAGVLRMGAKSLTASAAGIVSSSITLTSEGDHTITLAGTAADGTPTSLSTVVSVSAAAVAGSLPHTGAPILLYTGAGLMLVLLGLLVVMVVRKRRRESAVAVPAAVAPPVQQPVAY